MSNRIATTLALVLALPFFAACGSAEPMPDDRGTVTDSAEPIGPCAEGGVADDGDAEGCDFRVDGCCFADSESACAAAGCAPGACTILESYPAQVRCE